MAAVELRPMTLGEVLDRTFSLYKQNFWLFVGIAALPTLLVLLMELAGDAIQGQNLAVAAQGGLPTGPLGGSVGGVSPGVAGGMGTIFAGAGIASIVGLFVAAITQAATVSAVSDLYLGHDTTVRGSFTRVGSKFFPIFLVFLLVVLIFFTMFIMAVIAIGIAAALLHSPALVVIGLILALIPALYFVCRIAVVVPSAMLENTGVVRSLGRSMELTKGYAGQIFLIFLLVAIIALIASVTLSVLFLGNPLTAFTAHRPLHMGTIVLYQLFNYATRVLIGPIATIACCLMYYNLRVRKEAFDVQHLMASLGTQPAPGTPPAI